MPHPGSAITERLLRDAGIGPRMRVLDVGCGPGDVTLLAARLVGDGGQVIGVDRDDGALAAARRRAEEGGHANVRFVQGDLTALAPDLGTADGLLGGPFDAAVGRRVLMYLPDPVEAVRRVAALVRPDGVVAFQESDSAMVPGRLTPLRLHDQVNRWIWQTVAREGADVHMGFHLPGVLARAGLAVEHVRAEAIIQGQHTHYPLATIVRAMLPRIVRHGVASEGELDVDTLAQRLSAERAAHGGDDMVYVSDMAFGAWARTPEHRPTPAQRQQSPIR